MRKSTATGDNRRSKTEEQRDAYRRDAWRHLLDIQRQMSVLNEDSRWTNMPPAIAMEARGAWFTLFLWGAGAVRDGRIPLCIASDMVGETNIHRLQCAGLLTVTEGWCWFDNFLSDHRYNWRTDNFNRPSGMTYSIFDPCGDDVIAASRHWSEQVSKELTESQQVGQQVVMFETTEISYAECDTVIAEPEPVVENVFELTASTPATGRQKAPEDPATAEQWALDWGIDTAHPSFGRFMGHAHRKGRECSDWGRAWKNWLRQEAKFAVRRAG